MSLAPFLHIVQCFIKPSNSVIFLKAFKTHIKSRWINTDHGTIGGCIYSTVRPTYSGELHVKPGADINSRRTNYSPEIMVTFNLNAFPLDFTAALAVFLLGNGVIDGWSVLRRDYIFDALAHRFPLYQCATSIRATFCFTVLAEFQ